MVRTSDRPALDIKFQLGKPYFLLAWMGFILSYPLLAKLGLNQTVPLLDKLEEISLVFLLPYAFRGLVILWRQGLSGKAVLALYSSYLVLGTLSSLVSQTMPLEAAVYQFLLELKFPIILLTFIGAGSTLWLWDKLLPFLKLLLLASLPLILWQFVSPPSYNAVFPFGAHDNPFRIGGIRLPRAAGVFWFTGQLAVFAAVLFGFHLISWNSRYRRLSSFFWLNLSLVILISTFSRQEIAGAIAGLLFVYLFLYRSRVAGEKYMLLTSTTLLLTFLILPDLIAYTRETIDYLGLNNPRLSDRARVVLYRFGFHLGNVYWPLGAGLGSYGGHVANIYNSPLYIELGFETYWWYRRRIFMTDTFWPHILGETGWLGLSAYLLCLWSLLFHIMKYAYKPITQVLNSALAKPQRKRRILGKFLVFQFVLLILTSLTSPNLTSPFYLVLGLSCFGLLNPDAEQPKPAREAACYPLSKSHHTDPFL